jgi:Uma2 family endonuclease
MSHQIKPYVSPEDYLALERKAEYKSEYLDGEIYRIAKSSYYKTLGSLAEYLLVSQEEYRIEQYARQPDGHWLLSDIRGPEAVLQLGSIGCSLPFTEVYARISIA